MTRDAEIGELPRPRGLGRGRARRRWPATPRRGATSGCGAAARRAILMDMPPESGLDVRPFLAVTAWLRAGGFSAPEVLGADRAPRPRAARGPRRRPLRPPLRRATPAREPGALRRRGRPARRPAAPAAAGRGRRLDAAALRHGLPAARGAAGRSNGTCRPRPARPVPADLAAEYDALAEAAFAPVAAAPPVAVLRDYHAENLIWLPRRAPATPGSACSTTRTCCSAIRPTTSSRCSRTPAATPRPTLRAAMLARYLERSGAEPRGLRPRRARARRPAQPQDPRPLHPALPPRRQAALPRATCRGSGRTSPRDLAPSRRSRRSRPSSPATCRAPEPAVRARIEAAA